MHLLSMKNLVVYEEKSVQNHHSDDACQTQDQYQSGTRRGHAYRAPRVTADGCITRATYMQLMLWFETRSIPQSRLEQADQDLRAAPALSSDVQRASAGIGTGCVRK